MHEVLENGDILLHVEVKGGGKYHRQRARLFDEQDGKCYYCGRQMVLMKTTGKEKFLPRNLATIEHLRDRWHPERTEPANGERRRVLACKACNEWRGRLRTQEHIAEQRRRSQRR